MSLKYCQGHENQTFPLDFGKCKNCQRDTISEMIDLCSDCASKQGVCAICHLLKKEVENLPQKEDGVCQGHFHECFTCDVGSCHHCGEFTPSGMIKLCQKCSFAKGVCGICLKKMK